MSQTHTPSTLSRQILGASIGMLIAGVIYIALDTMSTNSLSGLLVDTATISDNAHQVRVNDKNVDDSELRKLQTNARFLTAMRGEDADESQTEVVEDATMTARVESRKAERVMRFATDGQPIHAAATAEHAGAPLKTGSFVEEATPTQVTTVTTMPDETATALPSSGFGIMGLLPVALLGALAVRRRVRA